MSVQEKLTLSASSTGETRRWVVGARGSLEHVTNWLNTPLGAGAGEAMIVPVGPQEYQALQYM